MFPNPIYLFLITLFWGFLSLRPFFFATSKVFPVGSYPQEYDLIRPHFSACETHFKNDTVQYSTIINNPHQQWWERNRRLRMRRVS